jgi:hypothetical protein
MDTELMDEFEQWYWNNWEQMSRHSLMGRVRQAYEAGKVRGYSENYKQGYDHGFKDGFNACRDEILQGYFQEGIPDEIA